MRKEFWFYVILVACVLGICGGAGEAKAAEQVYAWTKAIGGTANDVANSIAVDSSGNVYVAGSFSSTVDFDTGPGTDNRTSAGQGDIFLSKYDAAGNYLWTKAVEGANDDAANSVAVDSSGNVYIAGYFYGTIDFDPGPGTDNRTSGGSGGDIFLSKYDTTGNYLWAKAVGGANDDAAKSVAVDSSGNVYVAGYFTGTVDFDPGVTTDNKTNTGTTDLFVSKYDAAGSYYWTKAVGGTSDDAVNSVALDSSGNVYIAGYFTNTVDFDPETGTDNRTSAGSNDVFFSKYDTTGNYQWTKAVGGGSADRANSVAVDGSGNIYVVGYFSTGTVDFDPTANTDTRTITQYTEIFISGYDATGNYRWTKAVGGTGGDGANSVAVDGSGNVYIAGSFGLTADFDPGPGVDTRQASTSVGGQNFFLSKYDAAGNYLWVKANSGSIGGSEYENAKSVAVDTSGNVYIWGNFNTSVDFNPGAGTDNKTSAGGYDGFLSKYAPDGLPPAAPVFSSPTSGGVTNNNRITFSGTAEALMTVRVYLDGVSQGTVSANASGAWSYTPSLGWSDGTHIITAVVIDEGNNTSSLSNAIAVTIDTGVPAAPVITSPLTGTLTKNAQPLISGTGEALATITVYRNGTSQGTVSADGSGVWNFTPGSAWPSGVYSITAKTTDAANNISTSSSGVSITIDTGSPAAPVITSPETSSVTNNDQPVIIGTAEVYSTIAVYRDGVSQGTVSTDVNGLWSYTLSSAWLDGTYSLTATATDAANNTSAASSAVTLTVDTVVPAAPVIVSPAANTISGTAQPVVSGTAEAWAIIRVYRNGVTQGTTSANNSGVWNYTPGSAWPDGTYSLTATATDAASNTSSESSSVSISIDTVIPAEPVILSPEMDSTTNNAQPMISGTAEPGVTVRLYRNGLFQGMVSVDSSGVWSYTPGSLWPDGTHILTVKATDRANNMSSASRAVFLTIDTGVPAAPVIISPETDSTTSSSQPEISGTAEAWAIITVYRDEVSQGTVVANSNGLWEYFPSSYWPNGSYSLTAKATDLAGNISSESKSLTLRITRNATTLCSEWNGYLGMYNVLEHVNLAGSGRKYTTTLYGRTGQGEEPVKFSIAGGGEYDLLVHNLNGFENHRYGKVCTTVTNGEPGELDGRMVFYKPDATTGGYQFAFAMPLGDGLTGTQYVPYNTYQPSLDPADAGNLAANWIQLTNLSTSKQNGTLVFYDREGAEVARQAVTLKAGARFDFSAHDIAGIKQVGLVEWLPTANDARFQLRNVRYYYRADGVKVPLGDDFDSAFQLEGIVGSGQLLSVPFDTAGSSAVLELANTLAEEVNVEVAIYPASGSITGSEVLHHQTYNLKPHATYHLIADAILNGGQGIATVQGSKPKSMVATAMQYGRTETLGIKTVYGIQASEALGSVLRGSYNTYLKQGCRLLMVNPKSAAANATISMKRYDGTTVKLGEDLAVPAHGLTDYDLCSQDQENAYGVVTVQPATPNTIFATVLRIGENEQYRFPTPVR